MERSEDSTKLITALIGIGKTDANGNALSFTNYTPDEIETGYEKKEDWVGSVEAVGRWGKNGRHIFGIFKDDKATNPAELYQNTFRELKKLSKPNVQYKADVLLLEKVSGYEAHKVRLGDTILIKDTTFQPELVLSARVIEMKRSKTDPLQDSVVLGDYKPITITPIQTIQRLESKLQHNENRWNIIRDWAGVDDQSGAVVMKTRTFLLNENQETVGELNGLQNEVGFDRLKVGTLLAPNVVSYGATDKDLYVNFASGDDEAATNTIDTPYRSIARCLQEIPHYNNGKIRIFFQSNGTEIVEIKGVHGSGSVEFFMQGYTLDGMFHLEGSTNIIRIQNGTLNFLGTNQYGVIKAYRCAYVHIENMKIFGRGVTDTIVTIHDRSYCYIKNSLLQDAIHHLMIAQFGGFIVNEENVGSNARFGVFAWLGGVVAGSGTCPTGTTTPIRADKGGEIRGTLTPYAGDTGQPPPPAPPTVLTFPVLQGRSYRSGGVTGWRSEKLVYQGEWSGYGLHRGLWMFGNNPSASVTGKEIKRIRFYCTRLSKGGNSGSVPFYFRYHSYLDANSLPSGAPALSSLAVTASFSWGQGKWVDLSHPDFLTAFRNGTAKGIGLFLNNRSSSYYGIFDAPGTLEITY